MEDYQERYVKEYEELIVRLNKLHNIILQEAKGNLPFKLNCPIHLLREQEKSMIDYALALIKRAYYEKIDLNTAAFLQMFFI